MSPARLRWLDFLVAGFSLGAITIHDLAHVRAGRAPDVLWICNVAAWLSVIAPLARSKLAATIALTWLVPGSVIWLSNVVLAGADILPTSWGVHIGGAIAGMWSVARFGRSGHALWASIALVALCFAISRALLPAAANVNAAHAVPHGWEAIAADHFAFAIVLAAFALGVALLGQLFAAIVERAGKRIRV